MENSVEKMFEKSSRYKYRFETKKGNVSVEDLWDIPLIHSSGVSLDEIAKSLSRSLKENEEESFVVKRTELNDTLETKLNIVKYIIKTKIDERLLKENQAVIKSQLEKIEMAIEEKTSSEWKEKSLEELQAMKDELKGKHLK
jgi:hypothetical protein